MDDMDDNKLLPKLSQDLLDILLYDDKHDVTIEVGNEIFQAHAIILNYRSPYFKKILLQENCENLESTENIKLQNISPEIFQIILRYIYGGRLTVKEYDVSVIVKILEAANKLCLQELVNYLESFLIENQTNWLEQNFHLIHQMSLEIDSLSEIQNFCDNLISKEPKKILNSTNFISISENTLIRIIRNDNIQMSEIQVWEHVLKWGLAQNPELPSDPTNLSKDDFNVLKTTLQQFVPLIKFYNLTSKEFLDKVLPYKRVLPKELHKSLLNYFLRSTNRPNEKTSSCEGKDTKEAQLESEMIKEAKKIIQLEPEMNKDTKEVQLEPQTTKETKKIIQSEPEMNKDTKELHLELQMAEMAKEMIKSKSRMIDEGAFSKSIFSNIITFQHVELISKWIDKLETTDELTSSYEFKLLIRGSRDGFSPEKFHEMCDDQSLTVTIIKVKDSDEILGGYNPVIWRSGSNYTTPRDSFIFSFKNDDYILSRVKYEQCAILNNPKYGPSFGNGDLTLFGNDFYNESYCRQCSYEKQIRETESFAVEEYEVYVFRVVEDNCSII